MREGCQEKAGNNVRASEAAARFHKRNRYGARLSQLSNLLAIFNYWNVINSSKAQPFCEAHHTCCTDNILARLWGAHTKAFSCIKPRGNLLRTRTFVRSCVS